MPAWLAVLVVALALAGCNRLTLGETPPDTPGDSGTPAATAVTPPPGAAALARTADARTTSTPRPAAPPVLTSTPTPVPAPAPNAATRTRVPLEIAVELDPPEPRAGAEFVVRIQVTNLGERPIDGVYIGTGGSWDRYTVLDVRPIGALQRDAAGWHIASPVSIAPAATGTIEVVARADQPGDEELTFAVREADPAELAF